ncbi:hypothetical protein CEK28_08800 [Xenophilus sp. AP218F]|nr:hypothetical protein CEK28_08800 [Xenophilus sp. AP218F]
MSHSSDQRNPRGAGRKAGSGPFGEPTQPVRLPLSLIPPVKDWLGQVLAARQLPANAKLLDPAAPAAAFPLYLEPVRAGFPSPAQGYEAGRIDLNTLVVSNPTATYFLQAEGDSMVDAGIGAGDILAVDFSVNAKPGDIVIARLADGFTVKRLRMRGRQPELHPENTARDYPVIRPSDGEELAIIGVVRWILKRA